jgi:hypothetical protein
VPGQVSAEVSKETVDTPENLTDMQKTEFQIGTYAGWLRLCGYGSKASQISSIMKKSPFFRQGETKMSKYDMGTGCNSSNEGLNQILGQKEQWERYLDITYSPQARKSVGPFDGLWVGTGQRDSGSCRVDVNVSRGPKLESFKVEMMIRNQDITGRVTSAQVSTWTANTVSVDASILGTVRDDGEFDLQIGKTNLGAELVLRGRLPKEGERANGKWDTSNCHGKLSLTRDYRTY